jgi:hypothetical protein
MNGHPRDQISTDLAAGQPTLSPVADTLTLRVVRLMSGTEAEKLFKNLDSRAQRSLAFSEWVHNPSCYLSEFDPATATRIEAQLGALLGRLVRRAKERGWEVGQ